MEMKDLITAILVIVNILVTIWTGRKNRYNNTVTVERTKWVGELKENIAYFINATYELYNFKHGLHSESKEEATKEAKKALLDSRKFQSLIILMLNQNFTSKESKLIESMKEMIETTSSELKKDDSSKIEKKTKNIDDVTEELISNARIVLKEEWERIKKEI